jgi:adenine-specific DNA-methyltransferase
LLAHELLSDSGSVFVQISDENVHHVRELCDEVFGKNNFVRLIMFQKTGGKSGNVLSNTVDFIVWYSKSLPSIKYRQLYTKRKSGDTSLDRYDMLLFPDGSSRRITPEEMENETIPSDVKRYQLAPLYSEGASSTSQPFTFKDVTYYPRTDTHWKTTIQGLNVLAEKKRIEVMGSVIRYRRFVDDFPVIPITDRWDSTQTGTLRIYVVQTSVQVISRCLLMTTDPGDLVLDITCGSGTTAYVAEQWGRRWITCDTSRIAITLAKKRLMTAVFDYYKLAHPEQGVSSGFVYKTVPHITLKSIANNEPPEQETLYDQPEVEKR